MTPSPRSLTALLGLGLALGLVATGAAAAAPLPKPSLPKHNMPAPEIDPSVLQRGLKTKATLTPRVLYDKGASMNVHRALRVEATTNKVKMDKHTQLWVHFEAAAKTEYDIDCQFSGSKTILTMDYANGRFVRQQQTSPSASGHLHHKVYARSTADKIKVYMQASGDLDWMRCSVEPA